MQIGITSRKHDLKNYQEASMSLDRMDALLSNVGSVVKPDTVQDPGHCMHG